MTTTPKSPRPAPWRARLLQLSLALGSGLGLGLAYAPFDQPWLVWPFALAILWLTARSTTRRTAFGWCWLSSLAFWGLNLKWLSTVAGAGYLFLAAFLALYWGLFGALAHPWLTAQPPTSRLRQTGRNLRRATLLGGAWMGTEWLRGWVLTGFGWNGLGLAVAQEPVLAQSLEWVGVTGLSFLPPFLAALAFFTLRQMTRLSGPIRPRLLPWDLALGLLFLITLVSTGTWQLTKHREDGPLSLRVLLVQQNVPQVASRVVWEAPRVHQGYLDLTLEALDQIRTRSLKKLQEPPLSPSETPPHPIQEPSRDSADLLQLQPLDQPDWILWPEVALMEWLVVTPEGERFLGPQAHHLLEQIQAHTAATLLLGAMEMSGFRKEHTFHGDANPQVYNSLLAFLPDGQLTAAQKQHLVPFGEVIPDIPGLTWLYEKFAGAQYFGNITPGQGSEPLTLPSREGTPIGVLPTICFEDTVGRLVRRFVRPGPQVIVNLTNDGWFGQSEAAEQHFANARLRAIELRRPLLRCANNGVNAVVSPTGSTHHPHQPDLLRELRDAQGRPFVRGTLYTELRLAANPPRTLYSRWGDWFALSGLTLALLTTLWELFRPKNSPARPSAPITSP